MTTNSTVKSTENESTNSQKSIYQEIKIEVFERRIFIKLPKNEKDIAFIRSLTYSKWDSTWFHWVIPNYPGNLELLRTYFNGRVTSLIEHQIEAIKTSAVSGVILKKRDEVVVIKTKSNRLKIIFGFNQQLLQTIKKIPYNSWDGKNKWWSIPYSESLKTLFIRKHQN